MSISKISKLKLISLFLAGSSFSVPALAPVEPEGQMVLAGVQENEPIATLAEQREQVVRRVTVVHETPLMQVAKTYLAGIGTAVFAQAMFQYFFNRCEEFMPNILLYSFWTQLLLRAGLNSATIGLLRNIYMSRFFNSLRFRPHADFIEFARQEGLDYLPRLETLIAEQVWFHRVFCCLPMILNCFGVFWGPIQDMALLANLIPVTGLLHPRVRVWALREEGVIVLWAIENRSMAVQFIAAVRVIGLALLIAYVASFLPTFELSDFQLFEAMSKLAD